MSKIITFDEIDRIAADHARREAARNALKPAAIRCVYTLASLLADLGGDDQQQVLTVLRAELQALDRQAWDQFGGDLVDAGWRLLGCTHPISCASVDVCNADPS